MIAQAVKIQRLIEEDKRRLVDESEHLSQELREKYDFSNIIGTSGPVRQVYEQVAQVAATNTTALIRGESGTGKELIAHAIHYNSLRAKKPFVKVSCAALPQSLIEAELFGHGLQASARRRKSLRPRGGRGVQGRRRRRPQGAKPGMPCSPRGVSDAGTALGPRRRRFSRNTRSAQ